MDRVCRTTVLFLLALAAASGVAASPSAIPLLDRDVPLSLTPLVELSAGDQRHAAIDELLLEPGDAGFVSHGRDVVHLGITQESAWVRFRVTNPSRERHWVVAFDNPRLEYVALYDVSTGSPVLVDTVGMAFPANERAFRHPCPAFRVTIGPGEGRTYYAQVRHEGSFRFRIHAWPLDAYQRHIENWMLLHCLVLGALAIMAVHSLFIALGLREHQYLLLSLLIACFGFYHVSHNGIGYIYLWPESIWWTNHAPDILGMLTLATGLLFTNAALNGRKSAPRFARVADGVAVAAFGVAALCGLSWPYRFHLTYALAAALPLCVLPLVLAAWRRKHRPARYFLAAWGLVLGGSTVLGLLGPAVAPSTAITEHFMEAAFLAAVILWSFALTDRVALREEVLKHTVDERTAELTAALSQVKNLRGLLPICCHCKKVRDDQGYWGQIEEYLSKHTDADLSHGLCPDCANHLYPGIFSEEEDPAPI